MSTRFGPKDIGGILGDAFRIYGGNLLRLLAIVAIVEVPLGIVAIVFGLVGFLGAGGLGMVGDPWALGAFIGTMVAFIVVFAIVSIVAGVLMTGAVIHAVSEQYVRKTISIGEAYRFALGRLGSMLGAAALAGLAVFGMAITVIGIPFAVYFGVRWLFVYQAALLEVTGPRAALSRSSALVKGTWWRVFGIILVIGIIVFAASAILGLIPVVGSIIGTILVTPFGVAGGTLLYYDLRVRKEEYSLEGLASELQISIGGEQES